MSCQLMVSASAMALTMINTLAYVGTPWLKDFDSNIGVLMRWWECETKENKNKLRLVIVKMER